MLADLLGEKVQLKDRLGTKVGDAESWKCHRCQQEGHIARKCPNPNVADGVAPPTAKRVDPMAAHRTDETTCSGCNKKGHVLAQCWEKNPHLVP